MTQLETIFHEQQPPLMRRLVRMVGDRETAADLCQETFVRAWRKAPRDATPDQHRGWLHTTASNLALDELRRRRLRTHAPLDDELDGGAVEDTVERMHAREAMQALAPHERMVLLLRFEAGLSHREIGACSTSPRRRRASAWSAPARPSSSRCAATTPRTRAAGAVHPRRARRHPFRRWIEKAGGRFKPIDHRDVDREIAMADGLRARRQPPRRRPVDLRRARPVPRVALPIDA